MRSNNINNIYTVILLLVTLLYGGRGWLVPCYIWTLQSKYLGIDPPADEWTQKEWVS